MTHAILPSFSRRFVPALLAVSLVAIGGAAQAASSPAPQLTEAQREACKSDLMRLCPGTRPGGGRVRQCFEKNIENLSPLCRQAVEASQPKPG